MPIIIDADEPLRITLATQNEGKRLEMTQQAKNAGLPLEFVIDPKAPEIDETGKTFLENAWLKAENSPPVTTSGLVLADDSGLVVDSLAGRYGLNPFPGIYSNRWLTPELKEELVGDADVLTLPTDKKRENGVRNGDLCQAVLTLLKGNRQRSARFCCGMVLWHPERGRIFETLDSTELWVTDGHPRGSKGFGYDPIMLPVAANGLIGERTMAELDIAEKNAISHRGRALSKVLDYIKREYVFS